MNTEFWRGKRVFITGHTGFKGSWLSLLLQSFGANVTGFSLPPPSTPNLFTTASIADGMTSIIGDIRDLGLLTKVLTDAQPEIVIHLAAQALVRESYLNPVETFSTNIMGTVHLFEAVKSANSVRAIVNVTSDKCYANNEWHWGYREDDQLGGFDPYSNSKACAELITSCYRNSYFNPTLYANHGIALASVRAGNVIGGGDFSHDRLIPDIMRAIQSGVAVKIRHPNAVRPWQFVLEPLVGYLMLAENLYSQGVEFGESWNFGANDEDAKCVLEIVKELTKLWGEGASWELDTQTHLHEANFLKLDCSKVKARLNWMPRWNLSECLHNIVDWYKPYSQGCDMREITLQQINSFLTHNNLSAIRKIEHGIYE